MSFYINAMLREVAAPPIADAQGWVAGRTFPADRPLLQGQIGLPGTMFGPGQQRFLRVAFANLDTGQINEFARRLRDVAV